MADYDGMPFFRSIRQNSDRSKGWKRGLDVREQTPTDNHAAFGCINTAGPQVFLMLCGLVFHVWTSKTNFFHGIWVMGCIRSEKRVSYLSALGYSQAVRQQTLNLPFPWFESTYPSQLKMHTSANQLTCFFYSVFPRAGFHLIQEIALITFSLAARKWSYLACCQSCREFFTK